MLKTIKTTKRLRLDELIEYVRENKENLFKECVSTEFKTENNKEIIFIDNGNFVTADRINIDDLFTVEEEFTEDTEFDTLVAIKENDSFVDIHKDQTINGVIREYGMYEVETERIYALIDRKIQLIWERED